MTQHTIESLQAHINNMDAMSQAAFTKIKAIAKLALYALETPNGVKDLESLGSALEDIAVNADMGMNDVNVEAELAGANFTDDAAHRRLSMQCDARRKIETLAASKALEGRA